MIKEIIVYTSLILFLFVGIFFRNKIKSFKEYALGVKPFSKLALASTIIATSIGGGSTIGAISQVYEKGYIFMFMLICVPFSMISFSYLIPKIVKYYGCISMPEMISNMYGKSSMLRGYVGIISFLLLLGSLSMQVKALSTFFSNIFEYNGEISAVIAFIMLMIYSSLRGINGVIKTDIFQFLIFIVILPIITILLIKSNGNSIENLISGIASENFKKNISWWSIIAISITFCMPEDTPAFIHRFLLTKNTDKLKTSVNLLSFITALATLMVIVIAAVGITKYPNADGSQIVFIVIKNFLNNDVLYALFGVALISVIVSTADSIINTASVILVNDIMICSQKKESLIIAKITCMVIGVLSMIIALKANTIFGIILFFGQLYSSAIFIPFIFGLYKRNKTPLMFWSSSLFGVISYLMLYLVLPELEEAVFLISLSISLVGYLIFFDKSLLFFQKNIKSMFNLQRKFITKSNSIMH